ncbi:uncharacterized protein DFL_008932 [Arthrobotrys flagrans]|uniref:Uncharacterized protein n=1 Tax=Arthrobotrys flagrans TaxID=97331 RepID=A0A436ZQ94_ARTFL|nr:hypothetical protein DFL_008932 [Arthrobotrys flagrans]
MSRKDGFDDAVPGTGTGICILAILLNAAQVAIASPMVSSNLTAPNTTVSIPWITATSLTNLKFTSTASLHSATLTPKVTTTKTLDSMVPGIIGTTSKSSPDTLETSTLNQRVVDPSFFYVGRMHIRCKSIDGTLRQMERIVTRQTPWDLASGIPQAQWEATIELFKDIVDTQGAFQPEVDLATVMSPIQEFQNAIDRIPAGIRAFNPGWEWLVDPLIATVPGQRLGFTPPPDGLNVAPLGEPPYFLEFVRENPYHDEEASVNGLFDSGKWDRNPGPGGNEKGRGFKKRESLPLLSDKMSEDKNGYPVREGNGVSGEVADERD